MNNSNNDESHRLLMIPMGEHGKPKKKEIWKGAVQEIVSILVSSLSIIFCSCSLFIIKHW